jgi:hypothetical protein
MSLSQAPHDEQRQFRSVPAQLLAVLVRGRRLLGARRVAALAPTAPQLVADSMTELEQRNALLFVSLLMAGVTLLLAWGA